jgi:hypothetical protein
MSSENAWANIAGQEAQIKPPTKTKRRPRKTRKFPDKNRRGDQKEGVVGGVMGEGTPNPSKNKPNRQPFAKALAKKKIRDILTRLRTRMKKNTYWKIQILASITACLLLQSCDTQTKKSLSQTLKVEITEVATPTDESKHEYAAKIAGDYLERICLKDGTFLYEIDALSGEEIPDYNMVRHAGAIYGMLELYERNKDPKLLKAAERAIGHLLYMSEPHPEYPEMLCLHNLEGVHIGGNAVAILALTQYQRATGDKKYLAQAQAYGNYLLHTQDEKGNFRPHRAKLPDFRPATNYDCPYYPGEAIYALARLYQADSDAKWLKSAEEGAKWVIHIRDANKVWNKLDHDHWLLYGMRELHNLNPNPDYPNHAGKIVRAIQAKQHRNLSGEKEEWNGGYYSPPGSTPTGCRSEGLSAAWWIFEKEKNKLMQNICVQTLQRGLEFQYRTQITTERRSKTGASKISHGGFTESLTKNNIRIDFVQHNLSSILGLLRIPENNRPPLKKEIIQPEIIQQKIIEQKSVEPILDLGDIPD